MPQNMNEAGNEDVPEDNAYPVAIESFDSHDKSKLIIDKDKKSKLSRSYSAINENETSINTPTSSSNNNNNNSIYSNLFGISTTRTCPTCNGLGKVKKDEQDKLVALIPLTDHRLKPKRIWLWILSTFIVCLIIASTLTFILAPRNITISNKLVDLHPFNITVIKDADNETIGMDLFFQEIFQVKNNNYFEVHMKNLTLELNRISHLVAPTISYDKNKSLKPRDSTEVIVNIKYPMYTEQDPYVDLCIKEIINELFALITTTFSFTTLWTNDLEVQIKNTQYLYCTNSSILKPVVPKE